MKLVIIAKICSFAAIFVTMAVLIPPESKVFAQDPNNTLDSQSPPLRSSTAFGTYIIELHWEPSSIGIDHEITLTVRILDDSGAAILSAINYDLLVSASDLSPIAEFYNQTTNNNGVGELPKVQFENPGPIEVTVWINPTADSDSQSESATFNIIVAPEFPLAMPILVLTGIMITIVIFVSRMGRNLSRRTI